MSFDTVVPNAAQSPGLFPSQANNNFTQLKKIIKRDHQFNDSPQNTDGCHLQCTMIARSDPTGALPAGSQGIFYEKLVSGQGQLFFYNGTNRYQITPGFDPNTAPLRIVGQANVAFNGFATIYPDPGFTYSGTVWGIVSGTNIFRYYNILRSGTNDISEIDSNAGVVSRPTVVFVGNNLRIENNDSSSQVLVWSLIINKMF